MIAMKRHSLGLLLVFFVALVYAELLPRCSGGRAFISPDAAEKKQPVLRREDKTVFRSSDNGESIVYQRSHGVSRTANAQVKEEMINQFKKGKGVYGDSMLRPKGKKNGAEASLTKSASIALAHLTLAVAVLIFLY